MPEYEIITNQDEHYKLLEELSKCPQHDSMEPLILDCETYPLSAEFKANDVRTCQLAGLSISWAEDHAAYYPLAHLTGENFHFDKIVESQENELLMSFRPYFAEWDWGNHVSRFDWGVFRKRGFLINYKYCSYVMAFLTGKFTQFFQSEQGGSDAGLKSVVKKVFGYEMQTFDKLARFDDGYHVERVDSETTAEYACDDANYARKLHRYLYPLIKDTFLWNVEMPLSFYVEKMEQAGIPFIAEKATGQIESLHSFIPMAREMVYSQVERQTGVRKEYNLDSPQKVAAMLFEDLKLPVGKRSKKTKQPSTDAKSLAKLAKDFDVVHNHLTYKKLEKAGSSFLETLPEYIHPHTKRIHSTFHQGGVPAGRFASSNPGAQNWAGLHEYVIKDGQEQHKLEINVRDCVEVEDDEIMVVMDYKAAEFIAELEMSGEEKLIEKIAAGWDPHTATAALIFHMRLEDVTKAWRAKGKTRNFAMIYGENAASAAEKEGIAVEEMERGFEEYFRELARLKAHRDWVIRFARSAFYVKTYFGRYVDITHYYESPESYVHDKGDRFAFNAVCQGTAADIAKIGMLRAGKLLDKIDFNWYQVQMNHQGHDALMFIIKNNIDLPNFVLDMQNAMVFTIPPPEDDIVKKLHYGAATGWRTKPKVDVQVGKSYGSLMEYKGQSFQLAIEELVSKRASKEQPEEEKPEDIKVQLLEPPTTDQLLAFKALIVNNPGSNIIHLHMGGDVKHITQWPTSLSLKDTGRFQMIAPCTVAYETPALVLDDIVKAMKK